MLYVIPTIPLCYGVIKLGKWHEVIKKMKEEKAGREKIQKLSPVEGASPRRIETPPNCYVDGKITSNYGVFTYAEIYHYTGQPLKIKSGGGDRVSCSKCEIQQKYSAREIDARHKRLVCGSCNPTYINFCNLAALDIRKSLVKKGLEYLLNVINLGYDAEKKALIFPLNDEQYIELGFNGREYTQSRAERMKVLMHYNLALVEEEKGGFKVPYNFSWSEYQRMPYLDNRFYSVDGEIVIAGRACSLDKDGNLDNGKYYCELGKMILPFPII